MISEMKEWIEQLAEALMKEFEAALEMILFPKSNWYVDLVFSLPFVDPASMSVAGFVFFFVVLPTAVIAVVGFPFFLAFHAIEERLLVVEDGDRE